MNCQILIQECVGETRAAVVDNGRIVELHMDRWSDHGKRALEGDVYWGRVRRVETALNAAFIDIGIGEDAFLPFGRAGRPKGFHEGLAVGVRIAREAHAEKGPNVALLEIDEADAPKECPSCLQSTPLLAQRLVEANEGSDSQWADESSHDLNAAFEDALEPQVKIPGGGSLYFEQTRAMTTVDVDADGRKGQGNAAKMTVDLNLSAAKEVARQIRMRGLGGIIAIDFLTMRGQPDRKATEKALRQGFRKDRAKVDVAPLSQFCVGELARQKRHRSLTEKMCNESGKLTVETRALAALRRLEREGKGARGKSMTLMVPKDVAAWLEADTIGWNAAMVERIGLRFKVEAVEKWSALKLDVKL
jgi:Ribonuclease G/E